jgi:hypothetical protein
MRVHERFVTIRANLFALATLSIVACTADAPPSTGAAEQAVVNPPLPGNLNLTLNAKNAVTIGPFTQVFADVGSMGPTGSVVFDVSSSQGCCNGNVLANTVMVKTGASVGHVFGNDITVDGFAQDQSLGLDPTALPPVPAVTPATPGTTNVSTNQNQAKQLCPGQYGAISLGINSTLNLNGGVYQVTRLTLADGAKLEPSEPVVILVSGGVTTGIGAFIRPSAQSINPMSAADIRIEVGGSITLGDSTQVRAHLLAATKVTTGKNVNVTGAAWAKTINIGSNNFISREGVFSAQAPSVPPPCNDNNACTTDACVGGGTTIGICRNTPRPSGSSCEDGNACNGVELCDGASHCQPGTNLSQGASCADGDLCNGDETCNGFGSCLPGTPPVVDDRNACTIDACAPATGVSNVPVDDGTACNGIGVCEAGTCSIRAQMLVAINDGNGHLERIDRDTFAVTDIGPLGVGYAFGDCAWHPGDGALYMVDGRGARGLYRIDPVTGAATLVGIHGLSDLFSLAYHPPTNQLYGLDGSGDLYRISTTTGAATRIGHSFNLFVDGLVFDSTRNLFVALTAFGTFFSINVATAQATVLAEAGFINNLGMTYDPSIDRFLVAGFQADLLQFDPGHQFSRTQLAFLSGPHTCLALITP